MTGTLTVLLALGVIAPSAALAVPANDNFANREVISALPFTDNETDIETATVEAGDPSVSCRVGAPTQGGNTVWYTYTSGPSTEYVTLSTATSNYDTMVSVYEGTPSPSTLITGGCNDDGIPSLLQSRVAGLRLPPNTTYSIEVAHFNPAVTATHTLNLSVVSAPVYPVSKPADTADGFCDADCSLREAITASNAAPGAVLVPADTYNLGIIAAPEENNASGDLDIRAGMGIYGSGPGQSFIDGQDIDRVLHVDPTTTSNRVSLALADIAVRNGTATGDGGGVLVAGTSNFTDLDRVSIGTSIASGGGGGFRSAARGRLRRSTVSGNQAGVAGGGLSLPTSNTSLFEVRDSTLESNESLASATAGGGGVHTTGLTAIVNSTIHGNKANFSGGGLHFLGAGPPRLQSTTVSGNTADFDDNDTGTGGGINFGTTAAMVVGNSVLADNIDNNMTPAPDCVKPGTGALTTSYSHLEDVAGGCVFTGTGDLTGVDPGLLPIGPNGGPTRTQSFVGGPLLDTGDPAGCADSVGTFLAFDQRGLGFPRVLDGNGDTSAICDKGAFEFDPTAVLPPGATPPAGGTAGASAGPTGLRAAALKKCKKKKSKRARRNCRKRAQKLPI